MKKFILIIILSLQYTYLCYSQNRNNAIDDSLKLYEIQIRQYKIKDTAICNNINRNLISIIEKPGTRSQLFYAHFLLGKINKFNGHYDLAIQDFFKSAEYSESIENLNTVAKVYDELVYIYRTKGEEGRMQECVEKSIALKKESNNIKGVHASKQLLSSYYRHSGNFKEALKVEYDALEYYESRKDTFGIISSYHNIAMTYKALGNYEKALSLCDTTFNYYSPKFDKEKSLIYNGIGTILLDQKRYNNALDFFLKSLEIENKYSRKFKILTRYNNIGMSYTFLGNFEPARRYFQICIDEYQKAGRLENLANLFDSMGILYEKMDKPDSSIYYFRKSMELSQNNYFTNIYMGSALRISKIYNKIGKTDSAYFFLNKYHEIESLKKAKEIIRIPIEEVGYIKRKDKQLKEIEKENNILLLIIIGSIFLAAISITWIILIKQKIKIQRSILEKENLKSHKNELKNQINTQNKELISKILQLSDSNSMLLQTIKSLKNLKSEMGLNSKQKIQQLLVELEQSVNDTIWKEFEENFVKVHPLFYFNLNSQFSNITIRERRLCALIHLNFTSKEIAHILKQSYKSILVAKSRLRFKLNIPESIKITNFLHQLTKL